MQIGNYELKLGEKQIRILLADLQEHLTPNRLAEQLWEERRSDLTVADILIIRPQVDRAVEDINTLLPSMQMVFDRAGKLPVFLLTSHDFRHYLSVNIHPDVDDPLSEADRQLLVPLIRQAELAEIALTSNAILRAEGPTIFRAPSKEYCRHFFRAGNIQKHRGTVDVFFFWMLPWLKSCHAIVSDTWTISSIALNASRLLARYSPDQGRCKVDMLADYLDGAPEAESAADAVLERIAHDTTGVILALFSACMTGEAANRLAAIASKHIGQGADLRIGALYNLDGNIPIECLCELHKYCDEGAFEHSKTLPETAHETQIVDIDKTIYFPSVIKESLVVADDRVARLARRFFEDYGASGAFFVHRDSYVADKRYRHHAIYPDLLIMLKNDVFQQKFRQKLALLNRLPSIIISPPHEAGKELAKFACGILSALSGGRAVRHWEHLNLVFPRDPNPTEEELRNVLLQLDENAAILLLDDVSVTGSRFMRYQRSLRNLDGNNNGYKGQIHYMVGLARPENKNDWERRVRDFEYRSGSLPKHTLNSVEFLLLPDWDEQRCPWCIERDLYGRMFREREELPLSLARRNSNLGKLGDPNRPSEDPFALLPLEKVHALTMNSLFAPSGSSQATVFAAVASGLQQLRASSDLASYLGRRSYPLVKCLDPRDYLGTTFTDAVLRAAILRGARRSELERVGFEDEAHRCEMAKSLILAEGQDDYGVTIELFLAMARRKIPMPEFNAEERATLAKRELLEVLEAIEALLK